MTPSPMPMSDVDADHGAGDGRRPTAPPVPPMAYSTVKASDGEHHADAGGDAGGDGRRRRGAAGRTARSTEKTA